MNVTIIMLWCEDSTEKCLQINLNNHIMVCRCNLDSSFNEYNMNDVCRPHRVDTCACKALDSVGSKGIRTAGCHHLPL